MVRIDGRPGTFLLVIKHAAASTLKVVDAVKARLPDILAVAPKGMKIALTSDQSAFVRAALWEVVREAVTAAALVALMVVVFVGSPRSMLIVILSILLSILTAFLGLKLAGQSINTMTLGGIALAVGMLVDDATVEIGKYPSQSRDARNRCRKRFSTAPRRLQLRPWSVHFRFVSFSFRSCC